MTDSVCKKLSPPDIPSLLNTPTINRTISRLHDQPSAIGGHLRHVSFMSWLSGPGDLSKSSTSSSVFCRICHEGEGCERLISPCLCSGSVALVHKTCLEKWLSTANHDTCEICGQLYSISRHPRPFIQWLCEPAEVAGDQRNLFGDFICFLLLTPLTIISAYLCGSGAAFYFQEKKSEASGLICLTTILVFIYVAWLLLSIRYHCQVWFKWRLNNQDIRLVDVEAPINRHTTSSLTPIMPENIQDPVTTNLLPTASLTPIFLSPATPSEFNATKVLVSDSGEHVKDGQQQELCSRLPPPVILPSVSISSPSISTKQLSLSSNSLSMLTSPPLFTTYSIPRSNTSPVPLYPVVVARDLPVQQNVIKCYEESDVYIPILSVNNNKSNTVVKPVTHNGPFLPALQQHIVTIRSKGLETRQGMSRGSFSPCKSSRRNTIEFTVNQDEETVHASLESPNHHNENISISSVKNYLAKNDVKPATHNGDFLPALQQHIATIMSNELDARQGTSRGSFSPFRPSGGYSKEVSVNQDEEPDHTSSQSTNLYDEISQSTPNFNHVTDLNVLPSCVVKKPLVPPKSSTLKHYLKSYHQNKVLPTSGDSSECPSSKTGQQQP